MIRVLRVLEYTYASNERAEADMECWQIPANGTNRYGDMIIRSAVMIELNAKQEDSPELQPKSSDGGEYVHPIETGAPFRGAAEEEKRSCT